MPQEQNTPCICGDPECLIPYGLCHCGCGGKTTLFKHTNKDDGCIKGMPRKFVYHHLTDANFNIKKRERTKLLTQNHHGYKGVHLNRQRSKPWIAEIYCKKNRYEIGLFDSEYEAACAYDEAAIKHKGRFAAINLPERHPEIVAKEKEIAQRLLYTEATRELVAKEEGCSPYRIVIIYRKHTTKEQRLEAACRKIGKARTGKKNPKLAEWNKINKPRLGKHPTESARQKMSKSRTGKKQTIDRRIRRSARLQGIDVSEWKDFANNTMRLLTKSPEYQAWRKAVYERDDWRCQHCKKRGVRLHAHHIKPKSQYPELMFDVSNGLTLCEPCHHKIHTKMEEARHGIYIKRNQKCLINKVRGETQ